MRALWLGGPGWEQTPTPPFSQVEKNESLLSAEIRRSNITLSAEVATVLERSGGAALGVRVCVSLWETLRMSRLLALADAPEAESLGKQGPRTCRILAVF